MTFDMKKASALVRERVKNSLDDEAPNNIQKHAYQIALVAEAGLPNRKITVAYMLGIVAGAEFDIHAKIPAKDVFKPGTLEEEDYTTGIKDALLIGQEWQRIRPRFDMSTLFGEIFCNPFERRAK